MASVLQIFLFVLVGVLLLWFGFNLFFAVPGAGTVPAFNGKNRKRRKPGSGDPGAPRTCPVCSAKLENGERVKSVAFPAMGGAERFMHISGCVYCLEGGRRRVCPVCKAALRSEEFLVARLYEKPGRSHVHVIGCSRCKMKRK
jgi:hypothetical protein